MIKLNTLIIASLFLMVSCGTTKDQVEETTEEVSTEIENVEEEVEMSTNGALKAEGVVVDKTSDGCGFLVQVKSANDQVQLFEPMGLPENYKVDGKTIKMVYRMSRRPSTCNIAVPIVIDKVEE